MKKILLILLLIPFLGFTQINTFPWTQDFENGIGLTNVSWDDPNTDWLLQTGPTTSFNTGPQGDHTTGTGTYWYIESSSPNFPFVYIVSQTDTFDISQTPGQVLKFWYHMYGAEMGYLYVWLHDDNGSMLLDSIVGDQGDVWHFSAHELDTLGIVGNFYLTFEGETGTSYTSDICIDDLEIGPPPIWGCTDPIALNYDSIATGDDGSCTYIYGCQDPIAENYDSTATMDDGSCQYIVGCTDPTSANYDSTATQSWYIGQVVSGGSCNPFTWSGNYFGIDSAYYWANDSIINVGTRFFVAGSWYWIDAIDFPTNCNAPAVLIYASNDENSCDGNPWTFTPGIALNANVGSNWYISPCYYINGCTDSLAINYVDSAGVDDGSCLFVTGCTDTNAVNYNPAATQDDGTCIGGGITCSPGKQKVTVQIMLDQYAGETGWLLTGPNGIISEVTAGTYSGMPQGAIVEQEICIDFNTPVTFTINDTYGDGLGGAQFGGIDGSWIVYTFCDTISIGGGDFGYNYTDTDTIWECDMNPVPGCTDPAYQEYNPMATTDDGSCNNLHVWGCTDPTAFNYDSNATSLQQNPGCSNTLILTDWASDGWVGSFLYVTQGNNSFGPFTVQVDSFITNIPLNTTEPVNVWFYSYNQSQQTSDQCAFVILNPIGTPILAGGLNPYVSPMLSYNQYQHYYSGNALCGNVCIDRVYGCIDSLAVNYNPLANTTDNSCYYNPGCTDAAYLQYHTQGYVADYDDGSCTTYAIFGCMDSTQFNYDQYATVQWTSVVDQTDPCIAKIFGCLDPTAFNFDPLANTEDYSCVPVIYGCMDPTQFNYDPSANTDNNSCISYIYGCTDSTAFNYNLNANTSDGSCVPILSGCTDSTATNYNSLANTDDGSCISYLYGCTDSTATNYNNLANTDDGSCIPYIYGCIDITAFNYDSTANTDDGSCVPYIYGCMDPTMWNYDQTANTADTCIPYFYGCTDPLAFNYDPLANTNVGCIAFVYGCIDPTMFNYDPLANTSDGSCVPVIIGCMDATQFNFDPTANTPSGNCIPYAFGCMDSTMFNYDPLANTDNGSCIPFIYGCTDATALNYDPTANTNDNSCIPFIYGCTDSTQFNYNPLANTDNGSCLPFVYGCTDAAAYNYNPLANTNDNSCCLISGCTDSTALNYNQFACFDDNSCITIITGCTDVSAFNYDPTANVTDSTACLYDAGCYGGPGIPYWLNDGCYAWVIDVDDFCCNVDWDASCQSMYDYCQLGWPTSIPDVSALGIVVYPNPTQNTLTIETRLEIEIEVHDLMGKLLIKTKNINRLDLSDLSNGLYNLSIIHENKRYNKQIIKQ